MPKNVTVFFANLSGGKYCTNFEILVFKAFQLHWKLGQMCVVVLTKRFVCQVVLGSQPTLIRDRVFVVTAVARVRIHPFVR